MKDLIDRKAVLKIINDELEYSDNIYATSMCITIRRAVKDLPSAQPEIIRCKDCKHWREGTAFSYCDKLYGMGVLDALDYMVAEDDYCSMAERRTDEE